MKSIGFIGMGNMGYAIAKGIRSKYRDVPIGMIDKDEDLASARGKTFGGVVYSSYDLLFKNSDIIIVAIKPQHMDSLFEDVKKISKNKKIITIAAGKKISFFSENLETDQVVRFMPNIAAKTSSSITAVTFGNEVRKDFRKDALAVAEAFGKYIILPENLMPAFTGLSGSGIAYVFAFLHAMALGGTHSGIPYDSSLDIAVKTVEGALSLLKEDKSNPVTSLTKVISAGGTTIAGIKALEENSFTASVMEAIGRAAQKAKDFEK